MLINYNSHFPHWTKAPHVKDTAPGNFFDNISVLCSYWKMNRFSSLFGRMRSVIVGMVHIRALPGILQLNFPKMQQNSINEYIIAQADVPRIPDCVIPCILLNTSCMTTSIWVFCDIA